MRISTHLKMTSDRHLLCWVKATAESTLVDLNEKHWQALLSETPLCILREDIWSVFLILVILQDKDMNMINNLHNNMARFHQACKHKNLLRTNDFVQQKVVTSRPQTVTVTIAATGTPFIFLLSQDILLSRICSTALWNLVLKLDETWRGMVP